MHKSVTFELLLNVNTDTVYAYQAIKPLCNRAADVFTFSNKQLNLELTLDWIAILRVGRNINVHVKHCCRAAKKQ